MPFDQVLFGRVVAWDEFTILHGLPCAAPWRLTPFGTFLDMLEPLPCIVFNGELDDLKLDSGR